MNKTPIIRNTPALEPGDVGDLSENMIVKAATASLKMQRSLFLKRQHNLPKGVRLSVENQHGHKRLVQTYEINGTRHRHNLNPNDSEYKKCILSYIYGQAIKNIEHSLTKLETINCPKSADCLNAALSTVCKTLPLFDFEELSAWVYEDLLSARQNNLNSSYETSSFMPEKKIHRTISGIKVRSKSEIMIADQLFLHKIPFVYEAVLYINQNTFYPDFLIERSDGKLFYWEHFGLTQDDGYLFKMQKKLKAYKSANIVPWDNLIVTYDSLDGSIDVTRIIFEIENRLLRV